MCKFNHTAHKALWIWLSENPKKSKKDWPGWKINGGKYSRIANYCFACEFTVVGGTCYDCPLIWPNRNCVGSKDSASLFVEWESTDNLEERASLALQIANLPVKEGVETE